jgi:hypothetical protein
MTFANMRPLAVSAIMSVCLAGLSTPAIAGDAGHGPYVVRGNTHMIIGVTLDEAAVRAALPEGLEPTEGITGGYNIYTSGGGFDHPAYTRAYVWADLAGYDSVSGPARYVLWGVTSPGADGAQAEGINLFDGSSEITETGATVVGVGLEGEAEIIRAEITLNDEPCGEAAGILNYPVVLPDGGGKAMHQYPFAADICGAAPVSLEVSVGAYHALNAFKPTQVIWAALARNLSFAGTTIARD